PLSALASIGSSIARASRFEQLLNRIFEILPAGEPDMDGRNAAFAIDHEGGGQRFHAAILIAHLVVSQHDSVINLLLRYERIDGFPAVVIHGDAEHLEAAVLVLPLELGKPGNFDAAGTAPGGPEIQQHHFALEVGEMNQLAAGVFEGEFGGTLPIIV